MYYAVEKSIEKKTNKHHNVYLDLRNLYSINYY